MTYCHALKNTSQTRNSPLPYGRYIFTLFKEHQMKILILTFLAFSSFTFATTLDCSGSHNTKVLFTQRVTLNARSEAKLPKLGYIEAKIKSMGNYQFEIEVFDPSNPSRGYATGIIKNVNDFVKWASWDREAIFEIACIQR